VNYDGVPIASPDTRADLAKPVIYWTPVLAPGNLMFYSGAMFPDWKGSAFATGLVSLALHRIEVHGANATPAEHWTLGFRVRDVAQAPDGALWLIEDDHEGGLYRLTPK
jgi:glucose/arabinose dehydrogenase